MMFKLPTLAIASVLFASAAQAQWAYSVSISMKDDRVLHWTGDIGGATPTISSEQEIGFSTPSIPEWYRKFRVEGPAGKFNCKFVGDIKDGKSAAFTLRAGALCSSSHGVTIQCDGLC